MQFLYTFCELLNCILQCRTLDLGPGIRIYLLFIYCRWNLNNPFFCEQYVNRKLWITRRVFELSDYLFIYLRMKHSIFFIWGQSNITSISRKNKTKQKITQQSFFDGKYKKNLLFCYKDVYSIEWTVSFNGKIDFQMPDRQ